MMKIFQLLVFCLLSTLVLSSLANENQSAPAKDSKTKKAKPVGAGDKIYTWIDESGNRIYSDYPRDGAEVMKIKKSSSYTPPSKTSDRSKMMPKVVAIEVQYEHFEIASPADGATIRDNSGNFQVALDIRPALGLGHKVTLDIDGEEVPITGRSIFALNNVDRGSHTLVAHILNADGNIIKSSPPVTIHLHRARKQH